MCEFWIIKYLNDWFAVSRLLLKPKQTVATTNNTNLTAVIRYVNI